MARVLELCKEKTTLSDEDAVIIQKIAKNLQVFADILQADFFIDCPTADETAALVVAQASPQTADSLYNNSVIGQLALAKNEPAVLFCLASGHPVLGSRGISQEQMVVQQNVAPIKNAHGKTIGALIMEQDISGKVEQEKNMELLTETTEQLSVKLMEIAMAENQISSLMQEGMILFDFKHTITHANARAYELLEQIGYESPLKGQLIDRFLYGTFSREQFLQNNGMIVEEIQFGKTTLFMKAVQMVRDQQTVGGIILLRDISDLKEKEKQLMIKSAVIKEIHHRVKNNLQTIASLLRLQMRRSELPEIEQVYRESINRINSIAAIHEILAQGGLELVDMREVIAKISRMIAFSMARPNQQIEIVLTGGTFRMVSEKAMSLALIITELIQNCIQHAFAEHPLGTISIDIRCEDSQAILKVADDGEGIAFEGSTSENGHLGVKIVDTLIKEDLGGTLTFENSGQGTEVTVIIPIQKED